MDTSAGYRNRLWLWVQEFGMGPVYGTETRIGYGYMIEI